MRRVTCLIGRCPETGNTFTMGPCVFLNHCKSSGMPTPNTCAANDVSVCSGVTHDGTGLQWNRTRSSPTMNLDSI
ncbi:hypothetical protein TNCV_947511 [Trichonephila clavipes]|nr:hypothetical protein TNCV_947511 [Trichonephila clavipes]